MTLKWTMLDRLEDKILVGDGCWEWAATKNWGGYGQVKVDGKFKQAHRVVYELLEGPIPAGHDLDHLCRHRGCVRPSHLEPVSHAENVRRGTSPSAVNALKTHCPHGHPYDEANTYQRVTKGRIERQCRSCKAAQRRKATL